MTETQKCIRAARRFPPRTKPFSAYVFSAYGTVARAGLIGKTPYKVYSIRYHEKTQYALLQYDPRIGDIFDHRGIYHVYSVAGRDGQLVYDRMARRRHGLGSRVFILYAVVYT